MSLQHYQLIFSVGNAGIICLIEPQICSELVLLWGTGAKISSRESLIHPGLWSEWLAVKSAWEGAWFFLIKLKQGIPLWRAIPLGLGVVGTWGMLLPLGAELGVCGIKSGQFCSSLYWSSKTHKFWVFYHHSSHLNWLDIACRWKVENKSVFLYFHVQPSALLNCLYLVQGFFCSILFSSPSLLQSCWGGERQSSLVITWCPVKVNSSQSLRGFLGNRTEQSSSEPFPTWQGLILVIQAPWKCNLTVILAGGVKARKFCSSVVWKWTCKTAREVYFGKGLLKNKYFVSLAGKSYVLAGQTLRKATHLWLSLGEERCSRGGCVWCRESQSEVGGKIVLFLQCQNSSAVSGMFNRLGSVLVSEENNCKWLNVLWIAVLCHSHFLWSPAFFWDVASSHDVLQVVKFSFEAMWLFPSHHNDLGVIL